MIAFQENLFGAQFELENVYKITQKVIA